jgi:ketosteroid isomerase-like protein
MLRTQFLSTLIALFVCAPLAAGTAQASHDGDARAGDVLSILDQLSDGVQQGDGDLLASAYAEDAVSIIAGHEFVGGDALRARTSGQVKGGGGGHLCFHNTRVAVRGRLAYLSTHWAYHPGATAATAAHEPGVAAAASAQLAELLVQGEAAQADNQAALAVGVDATAVADPEVGHAAGVSAHRHAVHAHCGHYTFVARHDRGVWKIVQDHLSVL